MSVFQRLVAEDRPQGYPIATALYFRARQDRAEPDHGSVGEETKRIGQGHQTRPFSRSRTLFDQIDETGKGTHEKVGAARD